MIEEALADLALDYESRALTLKKVAGGYQITTKKEYAEWVGRMFEEKARSRLSRAALESLAIIAFKQPISRVEVSAIRGVSSEGVIKKLLDARLITIAGRDSGPGRALLFRTTPEFLHYFGINEVSDLPRPKEVEELLAEGEGGDILQELPDDVLLSDEAAKSAQKKPEEASEKPSADNKPSDKPPVDDSSSSASANQSEEMKETAENAAQ